MINSTAARAKRHGLPVIALAGTIGKGVRVNCLAPGFFETELVESAQHEGPMRDYVLRRTPMRRPPPTVHRGAPTRPASVPASLRR